MSRALAAAALAAAVLVAGCAGGIQAPDNGGRMLKLSDPALVQARAIQEELHEDELASRHTVLPPRPGSVLSYYLRDENGSVRFADNSAPQPKAFRSLALFVLQTAQQLCHLPM